MQTPCCRRLKMNNNCAVSNDTTSWITRIVTDANRFWNIVMSTRYCKQKFNLYFVASLMLMTVEIDLSWPVFLLDNFHQREFKKKLRGGRLYYMKGNQFLIINTNFRRGWGEGWAPRRNAWKKHWSWHNRIRNGMKTSGHFLWNTINRYWSRFPSKTFFNLISHFALNN